MWGPPAGGLSLGDAAAGRGSAAIKNHVLPCSPPRALSLRLPRDREAGGWGEKATEDALCRWTPPASLSNLLLFGLHRNGANKPFFLWAFEGHTNARRFSLSSFSPRPMRDLLVASLIYA
jgi:hypothetical protein